MPDRASSRVGVVIATRNRARSLRSTLERLNALPERPPIVVVDNASDDGAVAGACEGHARVEIRRLDENRGAAARNIGSEMIDTPYVAFSDDDSWWAPGALTRAENLFDRYPMLGLIAARVLVEPQGRVDSVSAAMSFSPCRTRRPIPGPRVLGFIACGAVVRRSAFLEVGGFEVELGLGGEEAGVALELAAAGWDLAYVNEVVAHHEPTRVRRDGAARRRAAVTNELLLAWRRRRAAGALAITRRALGAARRDPIARQGAIEAARKLPRALARRRPVSPVLERELRTLESPESRRSLTAPAR